MKNIEEQTDLPAAEPPVFFLPTENAQTFETLLTSLTAEYQPETEMQNILITQTARSAWELSRLNREFDKSLKKLYGGGKSMCDWDLAAQTEYQRMFRYRAAAERAFHRSLASAENLRKLRTQTAARAFFEKQQLAHLDLAEQRLKLTAERLNQMRLNQNRLHETRVSHVNDRAPKPPKEKPEKPATVVRTPTLIPLSQLVVVRMLDGITSIKVHPLSEEMILQSTVTSADTPVFRHFEFPNGVPSEYTWVNGPGIGRCGLTWTQHFKNVQSWRDHLDWEAATANGRFLPIRRPTPPDAPPPEN